jgi:hypothetical protein
MSRRIRKKKYTWEQFDREQEAMNRRGKRRKKSSKVLYCPPEFQQLRKRCLASIDSFHSEGDVHETPDGCYVYRDNGASILAVAHLDVVQSGPRHFGHPKGNSNLIYNAQLDDRLGAWIILDVLPSIGINVDVLLTEGEESCRSTAAHFQTEKKYNWLIEFDRAGSDVVLYDYWTEELDTLLESKGNKVGVGTYSDISVLDHLGVAGLNWGIGYHNHHFRNAYFKVSECKEAIRRFVEFYSAHKNTRFPYVPYKREQWAVGWPEGEGEWIRGMESRQKWEEQCNICNWQEATEECLVCGTVFCTWCGDVSQRLCECCNKNRKDWEEEHEKDWQQELDRKYRFANSHYQ